MQNRFTEEARDGNVPFVAPKGDFLTALRRSEATAMMPLVEHAFDGIVVVDPGAMHVIYANRTFATWLGRRVNQIVECRLSELLDGAPPSTLNGQLRRVAGGELAEASLTAKLLGGDGALVDVRLCQLVVGGEPVVGVILRKPETRADIHQDSAHPAAEDRRRDPLTGLADRSFLISRLQALLSGERAADQQFAVVFIDLDDFKQVNDSYGHLLGDRVLAEVGRRLARCVREGDTIARFGGDEFVVLLQRVTRMDEVQPVIDRIHAALSEPLALPGGEITLAVSIGVAQASAEHQTAEDLLTEADRAMYVAKRAGS